MKNIRGKSVKKSRDWIQEKKVNDCWDSMTPTHTNTKHKMEMKFFLNPASCDQWISRTGPEGRARMSDRTPSSPAEREKTNFDRRPRLQIFYDWKGSLWPAVNRPSPFNPDSYRFFHRPVSEMTAAVWHVSSEMIGVLGNEEQKVLNWRMLYSVKLELHILASITGPSIINLIK